MQDANAALSADCEQKVAEAARLHAVNARLQGDNDKLRDEVTIHLTSLAPLISNCLQHTHITQLHMGHVAARSDFSSHHLCQMCYCLSCTLTQIVAVCAGECYQGQAAREGV